MPAYAAPMPMLRFVRQVITDLENRPVLESDMVPVTGRLVRLPGEQHRGLQWEVLRVDFDYQYDEVWVQLGEDLTE